MPIRAPGLFLNMLMGCALCHGLSLHAQCSKKVSILGSSKAVVSGLGVSAPYSNADEFRSWLYANMLLGFEVTVTNPILDTIPYFNKLLSNWIQSKSRRAEHQIIPLRYPISDGDARELAIKMKRLFQSLDPEEDLPMEQINEIIRVARLVPDVRSLQLHFMPPNLEVRNSEGETFKVHTNNSPFTLEFELMDSSTMTLNVEHGALEFHKPPVGPLEIDRAWKPLMNLMNAHGFRGSVAVGYDGGGGQVHVGFRDREKNLFVMEPRFLAELVLWPLENPGLLYALMDMNAYGGESTCRTHVLDGGNDPSSQAKVKQNQEELQIFLNRLLKLKPQFDSATSKKRRSEIDLLIPPFIRQHESYVSLKPSSDPARGPRLELRFPRSFGSFADLRALAELVIEEFIYWYSQPPRSSVTRASFVNPASLNVRLLQLQLMTRLNQLALGERTKNRLSRFGGAGFFELKRPLILDLRAWMNRIKYSEAPPRRHKGDAIDLYLGEAMEAAGFTHGVLDGISFQKLGNMGSIRLSTNNRRAAIHLLTLIDEKNVRRIENIRVFLRQNADGHYEVILENGLRRWSWAGGKLEILAMNTEGLKDQDETFYQLQLQQFGIRGNLRRIYNAYIDLASPLVIHISNPKDPEILEKVRTLVANGVRTEKVELHEYQGDQWMFVWGEDFVREIEKNPRVSIVFLSASGKQLDAITNRRLFE